MFSHIMIGTNNLERAKAFYDSVLGALGVPPARVDGHRIFYRTPTGVFSVTELINGEGATCVNGMTIGFAVSLAGPSRCMACGWPCCRWDYLRKPSGRARRQCGQAISRLST